ncbi:MAG TPA: hypothetical protein VKP11_11825 [Frankiaceae bacterium]|nr:hypothetical protein [Frankiaceae bacterium]
MDRWPAALRPDSDGLRTAVAELAQADLLDALAVLRDLDGWIGNPTTWAILAACRRGATWSEVGEALGTTEQAAHERFRSWARRHCG